MKTVTLTGVMIMLCLFGRAQPQAIQPLFINDRLPDLTLSHVINNPSATVQLSALQANHSKMVLFDFWITSCIPCIKQFPKLDSLQRLFNGDLQIILVTPETTEHVQDFLKKWEARYHMKFSFPIVTSDTLLTQYFRQQSKPNYAWLAADNVYMAQTSTAMVSATVIEAVIRKMKTEVHNRGFLDPTSQP